MSGRYWHGCAFYAVIGLAAPIHAQSHCDGLEAIVAASRSQFDAIRGPALSATSWRGTILLAGFSSCEVNLLKDAEVIYSCVTELPSRAASHAEQNRIAASLAECLGPEPSLKAMETDSIAMTTVLSSDAAIVFSLSSMQSYSPTGDLWTTRFQIGSSSPQTAAATGAPAEAPAVLPKGSDLCPQFLKVLTAASDGFRTIRTKGNEEAGWDTSLRLPGLSHCSVKVRYSGTLEYECDVASSMTREAATTNTAAATALITSCLGRDWEVNTRTRENDTHIEFWKGNHEPTVELQLSDPAYTGDTWDLTLQIEEPE